MKIKGMDLDTNGVYEPREDSLLLAEAVVEEKTAGEVLDMGTGTGIQALVASRTAKRVKGVDISQKAVKTAETNAKRNGIKNAFFRQSDLFGSVSGLFDVVIFNPPYLPEKQGLHQDSEQWAGGRTGREVISRFARKAGDHLKKDGKILVAISSLTGLEETKNIFEKNGFSASVLKEKKIPWEKLYVLGIKASSLHQGPP